MDEFDTFYNKAIKFLSYRPRSEKEIRSHFAANFAKATLAKKASMRQGQSVSQETIELVIKKLKEQKYLNDEEFAKWWVEQRIHFRPRGLRVIKLELKQKGVNKEIIEEVFENQESGIKNQEEIARKLVEKRLSRYKGLPKEKVYEKLVRFLSSRGFEYDIIKEVIGKIS